MRFELQAAVGTNDVKGKLELVLQNGSLHCRLNLMENTLAAVRVNLLPYQKCLATHGSAITIRILHAVLREGLEHSAH